MQCSHQAAALRDSRKKNWDGALKTKKMCPFGRRGKLLVKRTLEYRLWSSFNGQPNTPAFCLFKWLKNVLLKDSVFNSIAINFVVRTYVVKIGVYIVLCPPYWIR